MADAGLNGIVESLRNLGPGSDEYRRVLTQMLPMIREVVSGGWAPADPSELSEADESAVRDRAIRELDWISLIRGELLLPLEEVTVAERKEAIGKAMRAGIPASALVKSTGLTLARIYQIRDGRR